CYNAPVSHVQSILIRFRQRNRLLVLFALCFFLFPCQRPVAACDDSLIRIFQATNPDERFTDQIGQIITRVKTLGELINRGDYQNSREQLYNLMQRWLEFDNGYLLQPPFPVDDMSVWRQQSSRIAERIGAIQAKFKINRFDRVHPDLDFLVTDLTNLYAQKSAQLPLFQVLIRLDALAAALNPAIEDGASIASSARLFSLALDDWKSLDPVSEHHPSLTKLQSQAQILAQTPPRDLLRRNELCQVIRSEYETLKRRFVLPSADARQTPPAPPEKTASEAHSSF
ncbi:MAG TPA: hypothetical protein PKM25_02310, partial [Candidatus Ozemobacteraceae bacterium]|nr:hypothetical protein [Candidatus Ozemobacteraceae bacterium]